MNNSRLIDPRAFLGADTVRELLKSSDRAGFIAVAINWLMIVAALALAAVWPNPLTVIVALIVLGGRQLGLAILMHDCAHRSLFRSAALNQHIGRWLCAAPVFADVDAYRRYHLTHHRMAGTNKDPDRRNYAPYPVARRSLARKVLRDLSGITGIKNFILIIKMNLGLIEYQLSYAQKKTDIVASPWALLVHGARNLAPPVLFNVALFLVFGALGKPWLYGLWAGAWLTTYMLFSRLRNAAEHAAVPDIHSTDPALNTRTTHARWFERLTIAPNHVNYHLEHHLLPGVPPYRLKAFHEKLRAHPDYARCEVADGYAQVIGKLQQAPV